MSIKVTPTWRNGKPHNYSSARPEPAADQQDASETVAPEAQEPEPQQARPVWSALDDLIGGSPQKRHPVVQIDVATAEREACQLCGSAAAISLWLGCGFKPKRGRQQCKYWVHQSCIGLNYKSHDKLAKVPFFCPAHMPH